MPAYSLLPSSLKKVHMQGGARCEAQGVLGTYAAAPRELEGYPSAGWVSAGEPFPAT
jgi:hypothetical protein